MEIKNAFLETIMTLESLAALLGGITLNVKAWGGHRQQTLLSSSMAASSKVPLPPKLQLSQLTEMFPLPTEMLPGAQPILQHRLPGPLSCILGSFETKLAKPSCPTAAL